MERVIGSIKQVHKKQHAQRIIQRKINVQTDEEIQVKQCYTNKPQLNHQKLTLNHQNEHIQPNFADQQHQSLNLPLQFHRQKQIEQQQIYTKNQQAFTFKFKEWNDSQKEECYNQLVQMSIDELDQLVDFKLGSYVDQTISNQIYDKITKELIDLNLDQQLVELIKSAGQTNQQSSLIQTQEQQQPLSQCLSLFNSQYQCLINQLKDQQQQTLSHKQKCQNLQTILKSITRQYAQLKNKYRLTVEQFMEYKKQQRQKLSRYQIKISQIVQQNLRLQRQLLKCESQLEDKQQMISKLNKMSVNMGQKRQQQIKSIQEYYSKLYEIQVKQFFHQINQVFISQSLGNKLTQIVQKEHSQLQIECSSFQQQQPFNVLQNLNRYKQNKLKLIKEIDIGLLCSINNFIAHNSQICHKLNSFIEQKQQTIQQLQQLIQQWKDYDNKYDKLIKRIVGDNMLGEQDQQKSTNNNKESQQKLTSSVQQEIICLVKNMLVKSGEVNRNTAKRIISKDGQIQALRKQIEQLSGINQQLVGQIKRINQSATYLSKSLQSGSCKQATQLDLTKSLTNSTQPIKSQNQANKNLKLPQKTTANPHQKNLQRSPIQILMLPTQTSQHKLKTQQSKQQNIQVKIFQIENNDKQCLKEQIFVQKRINNNKSKNTLCSNCLKSQGQNKQNNNQTNKITKSGNNQLLSKQLVDSNGNLLKTETGSDKELKLNKKVEDLKENINVLNEIINYMIDTLRGYTFQNGQNISVCLMKNQVAQINEHLNKQNSLIPVRKYSFLQNQLYYSSLNEEHVRSKYNVNSQQAKHYQSKQIGKIKNKSQMSWTINIGNLKNSITINEPNLINPKTYKSLLSKNVIKQKFDNFQFIRKLCLKQKKCKDLVQKYNTYLQFYFEKLQQMNFIGMQAEKQHKNYTQRQKVSRKQNCLNQPIMKISRQRIR